MASSFPAQIPVIINLLQRLAPATVLDIGKGFGKYDFLIHEYAGISNVKKLNPSLTMSQQSAIKVDAVEIDSDLLLPHLDQIYSKTFVGDIFELYKELPTYEVVLMIDVIEHLDKEKAVLLLKYFLETKAYLIIATPLDFFRQELYDSEFEHHISHWRLTDFKNLACIQHQHVDGGGIYLLSNKKMDIRGFGNSFIKKIRRIGRSIRNEL